MEFVKHIGASAGYICLVIPQCIMKDSIAHLTPEQQDDVRKITSIIQEVVNPEMILLFGFYAGKRNEFLKYILNERGSATHDFEFLVITKDNTEKSFVQECQILSKANHLVKSINLEIHDIDFVNKGLISGEAFWVDIILDAVLLWDNKTVILVPPRIITAEAKREKATRYFNTLLPKAEHFLHISKYSADIPSLKIATFQLHQAAESLYYAILLVCSGYKPKTHNLWKLRKKAKPYSSELFGVFKVENDKQDEHLFELLKQGYVDARYREDFKISETELAMLIQKVTKMVPMVQDICRKQIAL